MVVGLGNVGENFNLTRHNIGFIVLDEIAHDINLEFKKGEYGFVAKDKEFNTVFLKPTTFMNDSGIAVKYWKKWLNIENKNILVIVDDLHLKVGEIRFRSCGGTGGHNGLKSIEENIGNDYARLRIGIGNDYKYGEQADFVLGNFKNEEMDEIKKKYKTIKEVIKIFIEDEEIKIQKINSVINTGVVSSVG